MTGFGDRKIWMVHTVLAITIVIGLVFVSGCSNTSLGSTQVADFGNSKDAEQHPRSSSAWKGLTTQSS